MMASTYLASQFGDDSENITGEGSRGFSIFAGKVYL